MNASYRWLSDFLDAALTPHQMRDLITSRCCSVDELVPLRADLAQIVVGEVVEARPHPEADRLTLTKVNAGGGELLDVVCGAPNVAVGKKYPFAPVGATLANGLTIEKRKIRGATSNGMLCSARELELGGDHTGILELETPAAPGTPLLEALPLGDFRLVVDVTPNRPDLLSHRGLARELAAAGTGGWNLPRLESVSNAATDADRGVRHALDSAAPATRAMVGGVEIELADPIGCPRYAAVVIRGVTVGPSPQWLVDRLKAVGSRSINNVVDATNYMLHELGQPMHAFDLGKMAGPAVVIRAAAPKEPLRTLDGVDRTLLPTMTVIADAQRAQAIAGVIGGSESEVSEQTRDLLLEIAYFEPKSVRRTRRQLSISTDASYRFERGADPAGIPEAAARAVGLIVALAGGRVEGATIVASQALAPTVVDVRSTRVGSLLGVPVPPDDVRRLLEPVGFSVAAYEARAGSAGADLRVTVPGWRPDVRREVDIVEEVARLRGYDSFPKALRPFRPSTVPDSALEVTSRRVRDDLVAAGLAETRPMPFVRGADTGFVRVANPLSDAEAHLRPRVLDTLVRRAEFNLAHTQRDVRLFEIGATFEPNAGGLPREEVHVAALLMGQRRPPHWTEPKPPDFDEWDAKGLAERMAAVAFPGSSIELAAGGGDQLWTIVVAGESKGEVRRLVLDAPVWAAAAFGVELTLFLEDATPVAPAGQGARERGAVARPIGAPIAYRPVPTLPSASFDVALILGERETPAGKRKVTVAEVESLMRAASGPLLESLQLLSEYIGEGVPSGSRSVAWRLTFRHPERTLREQEIAGRRDKVLRTLEGELGVRPR